MFTPLFFTGAFFMLAFWSFVLGMKIRRQYAVVVRHKMPSQVFG